jgi:hypothetical protein
MGHDGTMFDGKMLAMFNACQQKGSIQKKHSLVGGFNPTEKY